MSVNTEAGVTLRNFPRNLCRNVGKTIYCLWLQTCNMSQSYITTCKTDSQYTIMLKIADQGRSGFYVAFTRSLWALVLGNLATVIQTKENAI